MDIVHAIVNNVASRCGCDFTEDRITHRVFQCFPSSSNTVTYHAQLHGILQANVSYLLTALEEWATSVNTIAVQFLPLSVESFCTVFSNSPLELCPGDMTPPLPTTPTTAPTLLIAETTTNSQPTSTVVFGENVADGNQLGVIGAVVAVVLMLVLAACLVFIVVAVVALRRKHSRVMEGTISSSEQNMKR